MGINLELDAEQSPKFIIFDTDMGTDDVWALMMLLKAEKYFRNIKLLAITCVFGNSTMDNVLNNTFAILDNMMRSDIPVYKGASEALICSERVHDHDPFNGINGLGGIDLKPYTSNIDASDRVQPQNAIEIIHKLVMERPNEVSIICIGPLTNMALALRTYNDIRDNIKELFVMGGNYNGVGNITTNAEYNFYSDPEAAHIVLDSVKCPITIVPWEACMEKAVGISMEWRFELVKDVTCKCIELLNLAESICYRDAIDWMPTDAFLMAAFLFPNLSVRKSRQIHATVELFGKYTRGQMVLDHLNKKPANVTVIESLCTEGCKQIFHWTVPTSK